MSSNAYVPFAGRKSPFVSTLPSAISASPTLNGSGSPEGVIPGVPGQTYTDLETGDLYVKMAGTQAMGWNLVSHANVFTSGNNKVTLCTADPNNVIVATGAAICVGSGPVEGTIWVKSTQGTSSNEWVPVIA